MASDESEAEGKPNGKYINSFVSFLKGTTGKDNLSEIQSENTVGDTGDANIQSVKRVDEDTCIMDEKVNGSPNSLHSNKEGNVQSITPMQKDYDEKDRNSSSLGFTEEIKDSDNNSENDSRSSSSTGKNVAKRGRKRKHTDFGEPPQRATPRRAARNVKCYVDDDDAFNEIDEMRSSDPDYNLSDSDDDPDFDPSLRGGPNTPEIESRARRGRGGRGRGRGASRGTGATTGSTRGTAVRQSVESADEDSNSGTGGMAPSLNLADSNHEDPSNGANAQRRRGRPPVYQTATPASAVESPQPQPQQQPSQQISDNTVSSTDDATKASAGKLSSAYHYAATRTRQNQAIRLPEGPNLTAEQLKLIESQFKSGDFVMAKKDTDMMENPPIWRIDGKSLLQKFQAFEKDGKMLYRNISTYSGWTSQAKALYLPVKVNFVFQSRYDTVVELVGFKGLHGAAEGAAEDEPAQIIDKPVWLPRNKDFEISEELRAHMPSFEIYLQTLISQALDNNFLQEIYEENDAYFVDRVKVIDELTEQRKAKILQMAHWDTKFQTSLDTWPCVNTMVTKNTEKCQACGEHVVTMLSQFYGQPYDQKTLRSKEPSIWDLDHKNFETCDSCSMLSQLYNKVAHQKYEYYSQCKSTVTNVRVSQPNKSTTNVLRDLLANDEWITGLFRSMCTTWIKVDNLHQERFSGGDHDQKGAACTPSASGGNPVAPINNVEPSSAPQGADDDDPDDPAAVETLTPTANTTTAAVKAEGAGGEAATT